MWSGLWGNESNKSNKSQIDPMPLLQGFGEENQLGLSVPQNIPRAPVSSSVSKPGICQDKKIRYPAGVTLVALLALIGVTVGVVLPAEICRAHRWESDLNVNAKDNRVNVTVANYGFGDFSHVELSLLSPMVLTTYFTLLNNTNCSWQSSLGDSGELLPGQTNATDVACFADAPHVIPEGGSAQYSFACAEVPTVIDVSTTFTFTAGRVEDSPSRKAEPTVVKQANLRGAASSGGAASVSGKSSSFCDSSQPLSINLSVPATTLVVWDTLASVDQRAAAEAFASRTI